MDYTIKIGGEAGQGIQTIGGTLARLFADCGYHVFTHQDYESRIRGGHNFYQIRFSDSPVWASRAGIDIVIALDRESITRHRKELTGNGIIIYDPDVTGKADESPEMLEIPFNTLALEHGGSRIMANIVATGSVVGMLGLEPDILRQLIRKTFGRKGEDVVSGNLRAAGAGYDYARKHCTRCAFTPASRKKPLMLLAGNDAIGAGAVASGLKFYSAYPMTPSTGIMNYVASKDSDFGIIVEQAEDEIAAINMALGASFAGVRAMTGTSGGGFALMAEGLSLAGMTETPVVIALAQRPGPATGLPTRTEQGDLMFALYAGHGEFPRVILAPGSPEQAFYLTNKAFHLAEKYQIPVIIMTDQYLADSEWTVDGLDVSKLIYEDMRLRRERLSGITGYRRHECTEDGVTPLAVPGESINLVVTDSDEHDEEGHMTEDGETRNGMMEKRLFRKLPKIREEISPPLIYGDEKAEIIVAGWGSTYGVMKEAVDHLSRSKSVAMLHFSEIYPVPEAEGTDFGGMIERAKKTICIENNATGQFARLLRSETGLTFDSMINKFDGRPFVVEELIERIDEQIG
jgi:2-oxoglutarate ferredoxin oxidoreductase subunit alpha